MKSLHESRESCNDGVMDGQTGKKSRRQQVEEAREQLTSSADMLREAWADLQSGAEQVRKAESLESALASVRDTEFDSELLERAREAVPFERIEESLYERAAAAEAAAGGRVRSARAELESRVPRRRDVPTAPPRGPRRGRRRIDTSPIPDVSQVPEVPQFLRKRVKRIARGIALALATLAALGFFGVFFD